MGLVWRGPALGPIRRLTVRMAPRRLPLVTPRLASTVLHIKNHARPRPASPLTPHSPIILSDASIASLSPPQ